MEPIEIILLPAILLLGIITSYEDLKFRKIRNKYLIAALIYVLVAYIILALFFRLNLSYLGSLILNFLIALVLGFIIWQVRLWSAADAKLFATYSALIPLTFYINTYFEFFPSFVLLINTFVPVFMFAAIKGIFITSMKEKKAIIRNLELIDLILIILTVFVASWVPRILLLSLGIDIGFLINFAIILLALSFIRTIFKKKIIWIMIFVTILRLILDYKYITDIAFLKYIFLMSVVIISIVYIYHLESVRFIKRIKIGNLKPGMMPVCGVYYNRKTKKYGQYSLSEADTTKQLFEVKSEGIDKEDIKKLIGLKKKGKLASDEIKINMSEPFAPYIFLGVILTLVTRGNFLILVNYLK